MRHAPAPSIALVALLGSCAHNFEALRQGPPAAAFAAMGQDIRIFVGGQLDPNTIIGARIGIDGKIFPEDLRDPVTGSAQLRETPSPAVPGTTYLVPGFLPDTLTPELLVPTETDADGRPMRWCPSQEESTAPVKGSIPLLSFVVPETVACQVLGGTGVTWYSTLERFATMGGGVQSSLKVLGAGVDLKNKRTLSVVMWAWLREARVFQDAVSPTAACGKAGQDGEPYEVVEKVFVGHLIVRLIEMSSIERAALARVGVAEGGLTAAVSASEYKEGQRYAQPVAYTTRRCSRNKQAEALAFRSLYNAAMLEVLAGGKRACDKMTRRLDDLEKKQENGDNLPTGIVQQLLDAQGEVDVDNVRNGLKLAGQRLALYCSAA